MQEILYQDVLDISGVQEVQFLWDIKLLVCRIYSLQIINVICVCENPFQYENKGLLVRKKSFFGLFSQFLVSGNLFLHASAELLGKKGDLNEKNVTKNAKGAFLLQQ